MKGEFKSRVLVVSAVGAATIAGLAILWNARYLILLIFAGGILALFLQTVIGRLQRLLKIPYGLAYAVTLTLGGAILVSIVWLRGPALLEQVNELRSLLPAAVRRMVETVHTTEWGSWIAAQISDDAQVSRAVSFLLSGIGGATIAAFSVVGGALIVILVGLYVSVEPDFYKSGLKYLISGRYRPLFDTCVAGAVLNLRFWLLARALSMTIIGSLVATGLWILGIPLAGTLGLITALLTFIPNLGPALSSIPVLLIALTMSPIKMLLALAVLCAAHFLEGNLVTPLMDRGIVKLPPALTLTVQCLLGSISGVVGIALAAPLLAVILGAIRQSGSRPAAVVRLSQPAPHVVSTNMALLRRLEIKRFRRGSLSRSGHNVPLPKYPP